MSSRLDAFGRIAPRRTRSFSNSASPERSNSPRRSRFSDSDDDEPQRKRGRHGRSRHSVSASPDRSRRRSPVRRRPKPRFSSRSRSRSSISGSSSPSRSRSRRRRRPKKRGSRPSRSGRSYSHSHSRSPPPSRKKRNRRRSYSPSPSRSPNNYTKRKKSARHDRGRGNDIDEGPPLSYKQFLLRQPGDIGPETAQKKYEKYKFEYGLSKTRRFFVRHKDEEWFQDKYDPLVISEKRSSALSTARAAAKDFSERFFGAGIPCIDEDVPQVLETEEKESKSEDNDENQHPDGNKNNGSTSEAEEGNGSHSENGKDDTSNDKEGGSNSQQNDKMTDDENEAGEDNKSEASKEGDANLKPEEEDYGMDDDDDQMSSSNKEGDAQKNGDAEQKTSEEKSSSSSNNTSSSSSSSKPETSKFEDCAIFIQSIPLSTKRESLIQLFKTVEGFVKLVLSDPMPKKEKARFGGAPIVRLGWVTFETEKQCENAIQKLNGHKMDAFFLHLLPKRRSTRKAKSANPIFLFPPRTEKDLDLAVQLAKQLDKEKGIDDNPIFDSEEFQSLSPKLRGLNVVLAYLREVHFFCYYCGHEYFDEDGLMSKCGKSHTRSSRKRQDEPEIKDGEYALTFQEKTLEDNINQRIKNPPGKEVLNWKEFVTTRYVKSHVQKNDAQKFKCVVPKCTKMFRGEEFLRKHIRNKHSKQIDEYVEKEREDTFLLNYSNDPERLKLDDIEPPGDIHAGGPVGGPGGPYGHGPGGHGHHGMGGPGSYPVYPPVGAPGIVIRRDGRPIITQNVPPVFPPPYHMDRGGRGGYPARHGRRPMPMGGGRQMTHYKDLDAAPAANEEEIDYGLDITKKKFHL